MYVSVRMYGIIIYYSGIVQHTFSWITCINILTNRLSLFIIELVCVRYNNVCTVCSLWVFGDMWIASTSEGSLLVIRAAGRNVYIG